MPSPKPLDVRVNTWYSGSEYSTLYQWTDCIVVPSSVPSVERVFSFLAGKSFTFNAHSLERGRARGTVDRRIANNEQWTAKQNGINYKYFRCVSVSLCGPCVPIWRTPPRRMAGVCTRDLSFICGKYRCALNFRCLCVRCACVNQHLNCQLINMRAMRPQPNQPYNNTIIWPHGMCVLLRSLGFAWLWWKHVCVANEDVREIEYTESRHQPIQMK